MPEFTAFPIPRRVVDVNELQAASDAAVAAAAAAAPVAGITAQITTVAGIAADVTAVAGVAASVPTVAGLAPDFAAAVSAADDTAADRVQTGLDRVATAADAVATAADRVQTGLDAAATDADAVATAADRVQTGLDRVQTGLDRVAAAGSAADALAAILPLGVPFPVWDHITGCPIPSNAGTAKFIKLTAGLTGVGQYNEGLLTSESVSGSAPAITATAVIVGGPMNGQTVPLINTEEAFLRPRTTSGTLQTSQNLAHTHGLIGTANSSVPAGANTHASESGNTTYQSNSSGGDEARPRNRSATYYMRIV